MKYLKYYISTATLILAIYIVNQGPYSPTVFFIGFSLFIILGDILLPKDQLKQIFKFKFFLNLPIYLNLIFLSVFVINISLLFSDNSPQWFSDFMKIFFQTDLLNSNQSIALVDKVSLLMLLSLFIGIMGTVPGHELIHRKKSPFDLFVGNWLLAFSWDCAFAVEHVQGHHKNVGFSNDPATAKRGENLYGFILKAIIKEQKDAWSFEIKRMKKKNYMFFSFKNEMLLGYFRSLIITAFILKIGGFYSMLFYLASSIIAKSFLEVINYTEHYGLVRAIGKPVGIRHSWNSNSKLSSLYLYNVTRHSSHHKKSTLKFWELEPGDNAPMMPLGYLSILYMAIISPKIYHEIMLSNLKYWDENYATKEEIEIAREQNKMSKYYI